VKIFPVDGVNGITIFGMKSEIFTKFQLFYNHPILSYEPAWDRLNVEMDEVVSVMSVITR